MGNGHSYRQQGTITASVNRERLQPQSTGNGHSHRDLWCRRGIIHECSGHARRGSCSKLAIMRCITHRAKWWPCRHICSDLPAHCISQLSIITVLEEAPASRFQLHILVCSPTASASCSCPGVSCRYTVDTQSSPGIRHASVLWLSLPLQVT